MKKLFLILILLTVTFNCSSVQVQTTGVIDNDYNNYKINRLAIFVNIKNLNNRSNYELQLYEILDQFFIERCRSIDVLPPIRDYTDEEYNSIVKRYDLDTFLILNFDNSGYNIKKIKINSPYTTTGTVSGNTFSATTTGGPETYDISLPYLTITSELYDVKKDKSFWKSTTDGKGNGYSSLDAVTSEAFIDIVKTIQEYKFIKPKMK
jgi:hypothetical protein